MHIPKSHTLLLIKNATHGSNRTISKYLDKEKTSKAIRQKFMDFYINDHNHNFIRSSPVIPYCDPTVAFVNAGMNQFKGIFLGTQMPQYKKVANSQKCVRVGGKHNDLSVVGLDGYHHTFFEMLGNWSFGDYFKEDACKMAWSLLTEKYKISKNILYVTYFGGDESLSLGPDLECRDIWRSIGVPEERILAFGMKENFWEMGTTGPCGPCTEIHVDLLGPVSRPKFINKGLPDLTELWNIVFIQYNRNSSGNILPLPQRHIDTGMGFERLVALLQGKVSNYDTDIFENIFTGIQKACKGIPSYSGKFGEKDWNNLDTSFRILADHARMIVVCLADGVIPEQNQKLRRTIRKVFEISDTTFKKPCGLLKEVSNYVVENLGHIYPELERNIQQIQQVIDYEEEIYQSLRANAVTEWARIIQEEPRLSGLEVLEMPGLVAANKEIRNLSGNIITPNFGFKLFDTFGLDEETIIKLAKALDLEFDVDGFRKEIECARNRSRQQATLDYNKIYNQLIDSKLQKTEDNYQYKYNKQNGKYEFGTLEIKLLKVIHNNISMDTIEPGTECNVILDKNNIYLESGGQVSDRGWIKFDNGIFQINQSFNIYGYIVHKGILSSNNKQAVKINSNGYLEYDQVYRLSNMRNHTATHLLNAKIKDLKGVTCQKSSKVTPEYLNFEVSVFGTKLTLQDIKKIEEGVNGIINSNTEVKTMEINSQELLALENLTLIPGETYPDVGIRIIDIVGPNFQSREACCGTHVLNTLDIKDFCIIGFRSLGRSTTSLYAVTGERAELARKNGSKLLESITALGKSVNDNMDKVEILGMAVSNLKMNLKYDMDGDSILPVLVKQQCLEMLNNISKQIKEAARGTFREFIEMEMRNAIKNSQSKTKNNKKYMVHYLACSTMLDTVSLPKATKLCHNIPVIVISYTDNVVKARCCVPKNVKTETFNAEKWLNNTVNAVFKSSCHGSKEQDWSLICNMKSKKINIKDWDTLLKQSIESAKKYAEEHLV